MNVSMKVRQMIMAFIGIHTSRAVLFLCFDVNPNDFSSTAYYLIKGRDIYLLAEFE